jgi:teichoic acid transport system permease protein
MYSMLGGYTRLLQEPGYPPLYMWLTAAAWAVVVAAAGFLFFISREREFTVRLV